MMKGGPMTESPQIPEHQDNAVPWENLNGDVPHPLAHVGLGETMHIWSIL